MDIDTLGQYFMTFVKMPVPMGAWIGVILAGYILKILYRIHTKDDGPLYR